MTTIKPEELDRIRGAQPGVPMIDVRTPVEHAGLHVPGVHLVPLERLSAAAVESLPGVSKSEPVYLLCQSGGRARQAAAKLEAAGFTACQVVEGGTAAWASAGLPVNRGASQVMSLERQVRIAAGFLVLSGVLLSVWVNPAFVWLSGFVGAGLIFAGATDWCGMGLLIARMPWNQSQPSTCCSK